MHSDSTTLLGELISLFNIDLSRLISLMSLWIWAFINRWICIVPYHQLLVAMDSKPATVRA